VALLVAGRVARREARERHAATATTKRTAGPVAFSLLNEPVTERARVVDLLERWFDRWLAT
jgi:hypothetical protein